jgi:amino-acid N-acetyltransferase
LVACVGLEIHGDTALLRSLAVAPAHRQHGVGSAAVVAAERLARRHEVKRIYLLTTTAASFFDARGYQRRERASAPPALQRTTEFSTLCPASAVCMAKNLTPLREVFRDRPDP